MRKLPLKRNRLERSPGPERVGGALKRMFLDEKNALRLLVRLVLALLAVLAAAWAVPLGLTKLFERLFSIWGVTGENVGRAPGWVQGLYGGWLYLNGIAQGAVIALAAWYSGRALGARIRMGKGLYTGLLAGALTAGILLAAFRLLDVMRFGHALTRPALSALTPMLALYVLSQALGAALATGLIGELLAGRHRLLAIAGCAVFYALLFGRWTPVSLAGGALFGVLLWLLREKKGGLAPAFGFLAAFSFLTVTVFGMPPWQSGALYETYPVSKPWLTGGDAGPWAGFAMTAILAALTLALALRDRKTKAVSPQPPARSGKAGGN